MDEKPFLEINILDIRESQVTELKKFQKANFNIKEIFDAASEMKYAYEFRNIFAQELQNPSDDLVRLFLTTVYTGLKTQAVIDKFRAILKKSLNNYISELMNDKIKAALSTDANETKTNEIPPEKAAEEIKVPAESSKIVTTNEELEAYFIVKTILKGIVSPTDITFKDTESYIAILYKGNTRKWICRFILTDSQKVLILPDETRNGMRHPIKGIYDIESYSDQLREVLQRFLAKKKKEASDSEESQNQEGCPK